MKLAKVNVDVIRLDESKHHTGKQLTDHTKFLVKTIGEYITYLSNRLPSEMRDSLISYFEEELDHINSSSSNVLRVYLDKEDAERFLEWDQLEYEKQKEAEVKATKNMD